MYDVIYIIRQFILASKWHRAEGYLRIAIMSFFTAKGVAAVLNIMRTLMLTLRPISSIETRKGQLAVPKEANNS